MTKYFVAKILALFRDRENGNIRKKAFLCVFQSSYQMHAQANVLSSICDLKRMETMFWSEFLLVQSLQMGPKFGKSTSLCDLCVITV